MAFDKAKFLARFVDEAREHISRLNEGLKVLDKNPEDTDTLNAVFRSAHTIKGSSRMMKLIPVSEVAHKLEDALDAFRQQKIPPSPALSDLFFQGIDAIDTMLDQIAAGREIRETPPEICEALEKAAMGMPLSESEKSKEIKPEKSETAFPEKKETVPLKTERENSTGTGKKFREKEAEPGIKEIQREKTGSESRAENGEMFREKEPDPEITEENQSKNAEPEIRISGKPENTAAEKPKAETIRIEADKLDELIKLMGEIVSGHSRSRQRIQQILDIEKLSEKYSRFTEKLPEKRPLSAKERKELLDNAANLHIALKELAALFKEDISIQGILSNDLQDKSLKMRMLPLSTIFNSFHRTVRYIARNFDKEIDFSAEGGETELDKKIIEKISDPLLHMIRNCIDHGIEKKEERIRAGKNAKGSIRLSADYEGENVLIRIRDDGKGIPLEKIKEKAVKKKIFTPSEIETVPKNEIINLIFRPGFSSKDIVTDISGRGVGMDVVKKNIIDDLKGTVQVETEEGKGCSFHIRLPLTMAVIHVLFIRVSGMSFAVPASYISEIVRLKTEDLIRVTDRRAVRIREQIVPIEYLCTVLEVPAEKTRKKEDEFLILIASVGNEKMGLIIDALVDEEDMVIKPLPSHMRHIRFVSGCIISGSNEIFNVLHIPRIMESAKEIRRQSSVQPEKKSLHILVADDSVSTREIEKSILESYGYHVTLAGDGREAYEKTRKYSYDLIVSDVEMPRMDGFSLTRKLREEEEYKDIPIILVTSLDKEEDKRKGIQAGADAYIVKGDFEQSTLVETVRNLLG